MLAKQEKWPCDTSGRVNCTTPVTHQRASQDTLPLDNQWQDSSSDARWSYDALFSTFTSTAPCREDACLPSWEQLHVLLCVPSFPKKKTFMLWTKRVHGARIDNGGLTEQLHLSTWSSTYCSAFSERSGMAPTARAILHEAILSPSA